MWGVPFPVLFLAARILGCKGWLLSHWLHFHFYLDTCFYSYREALILDGTKSESPLSTVKEVSSEAVIFRKVLQTLIIKCFWAFLKILVYKLWASAEVFGMSWGQFFPPPSPALVQTLRIMHTPFLSKCWPEMDKGPLTLHRQFGSDPGKLTDWGVGLCTSCYQREPPFLQMQDPPQPPCRGRVSLWNKWSGKWLVWWDEGCAKGSLHKTWHSLTVVPKILPSEEFRWNVSL